MEPHAVAPAFRTALRLAAESGSSRVSAFLPGASEAALNIVTEHGMRIKFPMLLMSSREFGNWAQYLPRNPGFNPQIRIIEAIDVMLKQEKHKAAFK
jgi:hypothetical protein